MINISVYITSVYHIPFKENGICSIVVNLKSECCFQECTDIPTADIKGVVEAQCHVWRRISYKSKLNVIGIDVEVIFIKPYKFTNIEGAEQLTACKALTVDIGNPLSVSRTCS